MCERTSYGEYQKSTAHHARTNAQQLVAIVELHQQISHEECRSQTSDTPNSYGVDYKPENTGDDDHDGQRERPSDYFVSETFINHSYE